MLDVNKDKNISKQSAVLVFYNYLEKDETRKVGVVPEEPLDDDLLKQAKEEWRKLLVHDLNQDGRI